MPQSIAVTGATGFIGHTLVQRLLTAGKDVRVLVRPGFRTCSSFSNCKVITGALEDPAALSLLLTGVDSVVHSAGVVRGACAEDFDRTNVEGLRRLAETVMVQANRPRLLSISSLAAREPEISLYAASKWRGEQVLAGYADAFDWVILRPPAVYGPGDREMLPLFRWMGRGLAPILGSPGSRLSLLYVGDLAAAVISWLDSGAGKGGIYEICDGKTGGYSWDEIVSRVSDLLGRRIIRVPVGTPILNWLAGVNLRSARMFGYAPMLTPGKVRELRHLDWVGNNDALQAAIDWQPRVSLEKGLRLTMGWPAQGSTQTSV